MHALTIENDNSLLWFNLGVMYRDAGNLANARGALTKAYAQNYTDVRPGQKVRIGLSAKDEARQSFFSLALPVLAAVLGFLAAAPIAAVCS